MKTEIKIGGKSYKVEASEKKEGVIRVSLNDKDYFFTKNELGELVSVDSKEEDLKSIIEGGILMEVSEIKEIKSPITGVISDIYVKQDEQIRAGQKVATLIAMKMENEIVSETTGVIKEIKVKKNQSVSSGDILIVLK